MKRILGLVLCVIGCAGCWSEMRQDVYDTYNRYVTSLDQECHGPTTPECAMKYRRLEDWKNDQLDEINRRRESVRAAGQSLQQAGQQMQQNSRQINCQSIVIGNMVQTYCH